MQDLLLIRKWMGSMDFAANTSIYVGPFVTVGSQIRGEYTTLSRVSGGLVPTEIIKMEEIRNAVGICAVPEFCGTFNCSFEPLYQSLRGLLAEPMPSPVSPGTAVRVQCLSPSNTVLALKCDSYGKFNPRPGTASVTCRVSRAFSREQEVPDNKPIRESCDCYQDGTDSCQAVEGGFKCECKKNWRKNSCWKSPDMCWVPTGHVNKCNGHGRCHSYPDLFVCKCDSGFGGATCALNLTNVTWFGSPDSVPFLTARKIVVVTVSSMDWAEMILKALLKSSALVSSDGPRDPLSYTSSMRKFCVGAAGLASVLFSHPNYFFPMFSFGCRMMFFIINSLMLYAFWLLIMESFITCCVYYGIGRNRWDLGVEKAKKDNWYEVDKPKDRWYLSKWFLVYSGVIYSLLIEIFLFNVYYDVIPSPFTCLGEITSLRNPGTIVNLEIMAVMAYISTGFGLLSQVFKRLWPERLAEQRSYFEWHKGRDAVETLNKVERCQGLQIIQAPVIFMTYLFNVWCQDRVATGLPQTLEMYFSVFLVSVSVFIAAYGTIAYWPWLYGHVMKQILPLLPWLPVWTHYSPSEHGYLTHEEIINRNKGKDVILSENRGWPKHPSEKFYVSLERREQCRRRLSRQYLEMRLMGVVKHDALKLIGDRFLLAVPEGDPESEQWEKLLETWTRRVRRVDRTEFKIPRNRPENREDYWTRILAAPLFTRADVLMENSDWLRFLYAYQLLGHIPLQDVDKKEGEYPQIRHYLQHGPYQAAWDRICTKGTWPKVASLLSPELYPDQDKTQRVRGEAHTALINLPGVKRYLTGDFLDKIFFVLQQARLRKTAMENEIVEEPNLHGLEKIRLKVQERRIVPQAIDHLGRAQWLAGRDLITLNQPNVAALLGDNDKPVDPVRIPPLIIEREGIPSCLYRW